MKKISLAIATISLTGSFAVKAQTKVHVESPNPLPVTVTNDVKVSLNTTELSIVDGKKWFTKSTKLGEKEITIPKHSVITFIGVTADYGQQGQLTIGRFSYPFSGSYIFNGNLYSGESDMTIYSGTHSGSHILVTYYKN